MLLGLRGLHTLLSPVVLMILLALLVSFCQSRVGQETPGVMYFPLKFFGS